MADAHASDSGSSFTRAFLPGLILGLVVGGLAGAFLPDWVGGPKLDRSKVVAHEGPYAPREGEGEAAAADEDLQKLIDEAKQETEQAGDAVEEGVDKVKEGAEKTGDAIKDAVGTAPGDQP